MKVKELIEELSRYNPDGTVTVEFPTDRRGSTTTESPVIGVEEHGCGYINPVIIAK